MPVPLYCRVKCRLVETTRRIEVERHKPWELLNVLGRCFLFQRNKTKCWTGTPRCNNPSGSTKKRVICKGFIMERSNGPCPTVSGVLRTVRYTKWALHRGYVKARCVYSRTAFTHLMNDTSKQQEYTYFQGKLAETLAKVTVVGQQRLRPGSPQMSM